VGENGAFYFSYDPEGRTVRRCHWFPEARRAADRGLLDALARKITIAVPRAGIASDQRYRESDLAVDWAEDVGPLDQSEIDQIVAIARTAGATVRVSSIHINIWFGEFSKLEMTKRMVSEVLGLDPVSRPEDFVFVGDSPNDVTMFGYFPNSIGVANVLKFRGRLESEPTYVTASEGGDGFLEVARALLAR
jgi:hydroxymethylpyrimidine pyrophosphatase-like HAD family hydrolase